MRPIVRISKPRLGSDGRWHCKALINVGGEVVRVHASAPQSLVRVAVGQVGKFVEFGKPIAAFGYGETMGDDVGCMACAGFAGDDGEFGGIFDSIVKVVKKVADNPIVRAIPYVGTVAAGASAAASVYQGIKKGTRKAKRRLQRIKRDAARGVPAAKNALQQLTTVARADQLRRAAKAGKPAALQRLRLIGAGIRAQEPAAFEAAKVMERLEAAEQGVANCAPMPMDIEYPMDAMDQDQAAEEVMGAIVRRRAMSPTHRALHAKLGQIVTMAKQRVARGGRQYPRKLRRVA